MALAIDCASECAAAWARQSDALAAKRRHYISEWEVDHCLCKYSACCESARVGVAGVPSLWKTGSRTPRGWRRAGR